MDEFVLPLTLFAIAAVIFACSHLFGRLFGSGRHQCCSFCLKHHTAVAKLLEGVNGYICNNCVKICSDVLIKECAEYRESFRGVGGNAEGNAASKVSPTSLAGNPAAPEGPPPATSPQ